MECTCLLLMCIVTPSLCMVASYKPCFIKFFFQSEAQSFVMSIAASPPLGLLNLAFVRTLELATSSAT